MTKSTKHVPSIKTTTFFYNICKIGYFCGAPNVWFEEMNISKPIVKICDGFWKYSTILLGVFLLLEWGSFFTQPNLTEKQNADRTIFTVANLVQSTFMINTMYYKDHIKKLFVDLAVNLKHVYNDADVEQHMIKEVKIVCVAYFFVFCSTLFMYGFDGLIQIITTDTTFVTIIPAWPDVNDNSTEAGCARVLIYIVWWIFLIRLTHVYNFLLSLIICLSHQFANLQSYFYSLNNIFEDDDLDQMEKELKYERALKVGIKLHSDTIRCTKQYQVIGNVIHNGQTIMNVTLITMFMWQIVNSERSLSGVLASGCAISALLISTAFLMLTAGDITFEAEQLPTAMYCSGWQHCARSAGRVRALLAIAMVRAQEPVEFTCLGVVKLSYSSFVSIVKMPYTIFSVLY